MRLLTFPKLADIVNDSLRNIRNNFPKYFSFYDTLYTFGFRPIELIELFRFYYASSKFITVKTAKGSNYRSILVSNCNADFRFRLSAGYDYYFHNLLNIPKGFGYRVLNKKPYVLIYENLLPNIKISMTEVVRINQVKPLDMYIFRHYRIKEMSIVQGMKAKVIAFYFGEVNMDNIQGYIDSELYI